MTFKRQIFNASPTEHEGQRYLAAAIFEQAVTDLNICAQIVAELGNQSPDATQRAASLSQPHRARIARMLAAATEIKNFAGSRWGRALASELTADPDHILATLERRAGIVIHFMRAKLGHLRNDAPKVIIFR